MSRIAKQLTDLIGNTPLLELTGISQKYGAYARIVAKLESFNPGGSIKDRTALSMIEDAEVRGILSPGATIIEPTSGNTGVGIALDSPGKRVQNDSHHARNNEPRTTTIATGCGSGIGAYRRK